MGLEVQRMLDEGSFPQEIDDSGIDGIALPMPILGVTAKANSTGLPLTQQRTATRSYTPPEVRGRSETRDRLIAEGRTGVMAGKGYFDWGDRTPEELFRERDRKLPALKRGLREMKPMEEHDQLQSRRQDGPRPRRRIGHRLCHRTDAGEVRRDSGAEPFGR